MKPGAVLLLSLLACFPAPAASIPTFAAADLVLGQPGFTTATPASPPTAASLDEPSAVVVHAATGKVFVADKDNNRVLRYPNAAALRNGAAAEVVFGQTNFVAVDAPSPPTASSLNSPVGLWVEPSGDLWVSDWNNHRVLLYRNATTIATNGPNAALVLGQTDFDENSVVTPPTAASMSLPAGLAVDPAGRLWVADAANNRVMRFGTVSPNVRASSKTNGANADGVLGQQTFLTATPGSGNTQFSDPVAVTVDPSGTLWVADRTNNRILGFPSAGTVSNGTNAARILGQPDFNGSISPGLSASALSGPSGVFADSADNLWVLDQGNNRALRFADLKSLENGRPAASVVGQPDFTSNALGLDARRVDSPFLGLFVEPTGELWLSDLNHQRVLRFALADDQAPEVRIRGRRKVATTKARLLVRGTASDDVGVTQVTVKAGKKKPSAANGTTAWKKRVALKLGRTVIRATASDASGRSSAPAKVVVIRRQ